MLHYALPVLDVGINYMRMNSPGMAAAVQALSVVALLSDNAVTMMGGARFPVGWCVGHLNALLAALVLLVIVRHLGVFQDRLTRAAVAEDKDLLERLVADRSMIDLVQAVEDRHWAISRRPAG